MGGLGGYAWVMVEWSMSQSILDAMRFPKIFGLHGEERHKVEKWTGQVGSWWVWWVCDGCVDSGSVDSGYHKLSENVWFVWS